MGHGRGSGGGCLSTRILGLHFDMAISTVPGPQEYVEK